ncbi:hypothetical protein [Trinickia dinghuensis]|uniref:Uncharacterized protein n=1 Tax=Trinickia dinghuensis TaxID=2291023 RepID=A0A3D8JV58_9BURK|nr:hypothetical protein [Trinickia dinghuensis]RDU96740.1 hypothetical protein DWV00_22370 [Trinickia dinghuensis]
MHRSGSPETEDRFTHDERLTHTSPPTPSVRDDTIHTHEFNNDPLEHRPASGPPHSHGMPPMPPVDPAFGSGGAGGQPNRPGKLGMVDRFFQQAVPVAGTLMSIGSSLANIVLNAVKTILNIAETAAKDTEQLSRK